MIKRFFVWFWPAFIGVFFSSGSYRIGPLLLFRLMLLCVLACILFRLRTFSVSMACVSARGNFDLAALQCRSVMRFLEGS